MISFDLNAMAQAYIAGKLELGEFEEWLFPALPRFATDPESADADFSSAIVEGLAEINDELMTEDEFRDLVRSLLTREQDLSIGSYGEVSLLPLPVTSELSKTSVLEQRYGSLDTLRESAKTETIEFNYAGGA